MKSLMIDAKILTTILVISGCAGSMADAQMGLRENDLFASRAFADVGPAIGSVAPRLDLKDFDGKSVSLESYRGKVVVLVKGGYT